MAFTFGYNFDDVTFIYFNLSNYLRPRSQQSYTVHRMAITKFANSSFYLTCLWKSYRRLTLVSKRTNKQMITNKFTNIWLEGNKKLLTFMYQVYGFGKNYYPIFLSVYKKPMWLFKHWMVFFSDIVGLIYNTPGRAQTNWILHVDKW